MPKTPINYEQTHFYKLCCNDLEVPDIYVGHTTDFRQRKRSHKKNCCSEQSPDHNLPVYQFIREHGTWSNWSMILLETKPCSGALEARKMEREYIEMLNATPHQRVPSRTKKEHYEDNKDRILQHCKEYAEDNKDKIREWQKQYRVDNKEDIALKNKQYYENNKE